MTDDDEPLEQMLGEHEWCTGQLDRLQVELKELPEGDRDATRGFAADLREYVEVIRCHIEVEESLFFDTAQHYLTESDRRQLTEEFESVHYDEVEEGVEQYWEALAHRLLAAERSA
jgi:hemerythrin-like domain-containing protein